MKDLLEEIFASIRKNKLRTALTGFSIAWGIFILIILLASGNGLKNGMLSNFNFMSTNSLSIYPGSTSIAYEGYQKGRSINLKEEDSQLLEQAFSAQIEGTASVLQLYSIPIVYGQDYLNTSVKGVPVDYRDFIKFDLVKGRFINTVDEKEHRKVVVIHQKTQEILLRKEADPIGKFIQINKIPFQVIGIYSDKGGSQNPEVYIPFQTAREIFKQDGNISTLAVNLKGLNTKEENEAFEQILRGKLGRKHQFKADDQNALWIWNRLSNFLQTQGIFNGINLFIWIIGIGTLIAGVVGVGNIMLITVKERTHEFGIRKALGATPGSIIRLVLLESIFITSFFGYIGMVTGIGLTELISQIMNKMKAGSPAGDGPESFTIFKDPSVDLKVVLLATAILILAGLLAGYMPARKAVHIKPIDALRAE